jgi:hypothetical protein
LHARAAGARAEVAQMAFNRSGHDGEGSA